MRPNLVATPATNSENGLGWICAWLGSLCFGALSPGGGYHILNCTRVNKQSGGTSVELIAFYAPDARFRLAVRGYHAPPPLKPRRPRRTTRRCSAGRPKPSSSSLRPRRRRTAARTAHAGAFAVPSGPRIELFRGLLVHDLLKPIPRLQPGPPVEASNSLGERTRISTNCSGGTSLAKRVGEITAGPRLAFWDSPAGADTLTLCDVHLLQSIPLEIRGATVTKRRVQTAGVVEGFEVLEDRRFCRLPGG